MAEYKILVTGPSWIGDMVMAQSLFKYLYQKYSELIIDVLAPAWTLPLLQRMPEIRQGIAFDSRHGKLDLSMRINTGRRLRAEGYHEAVILPRSLKSVLPSWIAGIKKRTGLHSHLGLVNNVRPHVRDRTELFVRRYLSLITDDAYSIAREDIPVPRLKVDDSRGDYLLDRFGLEKDRFVAFAPGAEFGPSKQWPMLYFAELADKLERKGLVSIILGSEKDSLMAEQIRQLSNAENIVNLCGETTLPDVIDILSCAKCAVTNDSGLMHLSYAAGARLIAIFGSTSPLYTPPLSSNSIVLQENLSCQPCFERTCRYQHYDCLNRITVDSVLDSITIQ